MDAKNTMQAAPPAADAGMDHSEEMLAEVDEPPDELKWSPSKLKFDHLRAHPSMQRRESLLTRQLHSETEHTDEERMQPGRAMSTQSTRSTQSATSVTELTSDDGHSMPSPAVSPPLDPIHTPALEQQKPLEQRVKIMGLDDAVAPAPKQEGQEQAVEANLGRKRCITFACRSKPEAKPAPPPTSQPTEPEQTTPPKRKCMLKFACPTRASAESKSAEKGQGRRTVSPPPPPRRSASKTKHRGSDSTVTHASPKAVRKTAPVVPAPEEDGPAKTRCYSIDSNGSSGNEATRFHEFATSEDEPEEWCQESTCHRTRLTVDDTLQKENIIRKTCEEVEEEVLEEDGENEEDLEEELEAVDEDDDESDEGFHSDDEGGFASSESERDDDSDYEWWKPGGASTAATSVEHLDRLAIVNSEQVELGSSMNSASSAHLSPRSSRTALRKTNRSTHTQAISIKRAPSPELPDSTDFVCGTLDEDRPIEQAYINRKKAKDAAKRPSRPQDIDPSFPTSDPEMDEEDDDDVDEVQESEEDDMMHGALEELDQAPFKKFSPPQKRGRTSINRSPPPPARQHHSPPPKRTSVARSPPPPKRPRSPPPRKLFAQSPRRAKSPAPTKTTSPPNSPTEDRGVPFSTVPHGLAGRPQPTHTASLPRGGPITLSKMAHWGHNEDETDTGVSTEVPKRGAIDIVKGVEFKRQRRKEKLYQKMCAKYAAKGEKTQHKVKPGQGASRMRQPNAPETGLRLTTYNTQLHNYTFIHHTEHSAAVSPHTALPWTPPVLILGK
ncbi:uncharacterized protein LTR77_003414 [Saxophila tyrrhenica]|uniref:Uncharacterized protein n=1 Tax=Saxophila tyrrhenica TaxID=1690608 RepID=A0AAV9PG55_9PEZI|nr:hypothetical protein LTR77_003414 [Saxophila tyrrhenica]